MAVEECVFIWLEKLKRAMEDGYSSRASREEPRKTKRVSKPIPVPVKPEKPERPITKSKKELEREEEARRYQANKKFGYVYLMRSENGYYKIGISKKVDRRKNDLRRQFPIHIEVIHYIACNDYRKVERFLHSKYSSKRVEYEWFNLDKKDVKWIRYLKDYELG